MDVGMDPVQSMVLPTFSKRLSSIDGSSIPRLWTVITLH